MHVGMVCSVPTSSRIVLHALEMLVEAKIVVHLTHDPFMQVGDVASFKMLDTFKATTVVALRTNDWEASKPMQAHLEAVGIAHVHVTVVPP